MHMRRSVTLIRGVLMTNLVKRESDSRSREVEEVVAAKTWTTYSSSSLVEVVAEVEVASTLVEDINKRESLSTRTYSAPQT